MAWNDFTRDTEELSQLKAEDMDYRKIQEGRKSQARRELGVAWDKGEGVGVVDKATMRLGGGILNMGRKAAEKAVLKKMGVAAAKGMPEFAALTAKESVKGGLGGAAWHAAALRELRGVVEQEASGACHQVGKHYGGREESATAVAGAKDGIICRTGTRMRGRTAVLPSGIEEIPNLKTVRAFFRRLNAADTVGLMGVFLTCWSGYG